MNDAKRQEAAEDAEAGAAEFETLHEIVRKARQNLSQNAWDTLVGGTETETTLAMLRQIKALGVAISMDDFGTGYSSLSYLRKFPFDKIKIDQSFIRELSDAHESVAIVRAVMGLGTSLGMVTMAEGVETVEQLRTLQAEGCAEAQGFLFSPAVPAGEITELLERIHRDLAAA